MSDTPITDAEAYDYETGRRWLDGVVSAHIVRKLERENAELMEVFKAAKALVDYDIEGESTHWPESNQKFEDLKAAVEARKEQP